MPTQQQLKPTSSKF